MAISLRSLFARDAMSHVRSKILRVRNGHNVTLIHTEDEVYTVHGGNNGREAVGRYDSKRYGAEHPGRVHLDNTGTITEIGIYGRDVVVLTSTGELWGWGYNQYGQLGTGNRTTVWEPIRIATNVAALPNNLEGSRQQVDGGRIVYLSKDGYLYGSGYNGYGQLGTGNTTTLNRFTRLTAYGNAIKKFWNLGGAYGCLMVVKTNNTLWASGYNGYGELGTGSTVSPSTPVNVTAAWGGSTGEFDDITGGFGNDGSSSTTIYVLRRNGAATSLYSCGSNTYSGLGDNLTAHRSTPYLVPGSNTVKQFAHKGGGAGAACMLKANGELWVWGYNASGQLGTGDRVAKKTPTLATRSVDYIYNNGRDNYAYTYYTTNFIRKTDGKVWVTGWNRHGECGVGGASIPDQLTYVKVKLPEDTYISDIGFFSTDGSACVNVAVTDDHRVYIWGYGGNAGMGNVTRDGAYHGVPIEIQMPMKH